MENALTDEALFVTGSQRSGSTLLDRLLTSQDHLSVLSQPFPLLFVDVKREFLRSLGVEKERIPLGHLFLESRYDGASFARFLGNWRTSPGELHELFARMRDYAGQYTRFDPDHLDRALARTSPDDDFAAVVAKLDRLLAPSRRACWFGSKESFCEEFVPALLDRGFRCAITIRDPRDCVASLNHGRGREFGGDIKPTLFNVRSWRKSVAIALAMEGRPRFHWCRYEDLVSDPAGSLARLAAALDIHEIDPRRLAGEIRDPGGAVWLGNSSFEEHRAVSTASVARGRAVLPLEVAEEIEATCLPELRLLGYDTTMTNADALKVIGRFREPYAVRQGMEGDAATAGNAALEAERLERLSRADHDQPRRWFLFERAEARLREALRT